MAIDWKTIRRDPQYKQFSYEEQLYANQQLVMKDVANDPTFQQFTPAEKSYAIQQLAFQKPTYENPDQDVAQLEQLVDQAKQGDDQAAETVLDKMGWKSFKDQLTIVDAIESVAGRALNLLDPNSMDYQRVKAEKQVETRDTEKAYAYAEQVLNQDLNKAKAIRRHQTVGTVGGFITDFAAWWGATMPAAKAVKAMAKASSLGQKTGMFATKMSGQGSAIKSRGKAWFWQSAVPEIAQDIRGGLIGITRENINGVIEERLPEDPTMYETLWENSKTFGEYFLGDMLFFSGLQVAKLMGKTGKNVFGRGLRGGKPIKTAVTDAEFGEVMNGLIKRGGLDQKTIASLPQAERDEMLRVATGWARAQNVPNLKNDPQKLTQYFLKGKGFDVFEEGGKWKSKYIPDGKIIEADNFDEVVRKTFDFGDVKRKPSFKDPDEAAVFMAGSNDMTIHKTIKANTAGLNIDENGMAQLLKPLPTGQLNRNNARYVGNEVMKKTGIRFDDINNVKYQKVDDYFSRTATREGDTIFIPGRITEPKQEAKFVKRFTQDIKDTVQSKGGTFDQFDDLGERILRVKEKGGFSPHWVDYAVEKYTDGKLYRVGDELQLRTRNGVEAQGSMKDIGEHLFKNYAFADSTENMLEHTQNYLWAEKGMKLAERKDGGLQLHFRGDDGKMNRRQYDNLQALWDDSPELIPKLPQSSMPDINITDNRLTRFEIKQGMAAGPPNMMVDFLDSFKDYKSMNEKIPLKTSKGNIVAFDRKYRTYTVVDNETGVTQQFRTVEKAREFVDRGAKGFKELDARARMKGARLLPYKGEYLLYQKGMSNPLVARSSAEIKEKLKGLKQPDYIGKELTDLDPQAISDIQRQFRDHLPEGAFQAEFHEMADLITKRAKKMNGRPGAGASVANMFAPADVTISKLAKESGMPELYDYWRGMEKGRQRAEGAYAAFQRDYTRSIGRLTGEQDEALGALLLSGTPESQWANKFRDLNGRDLTQTELQALTRTRDLLGRSSEEGLFNLFGIDNYKFLTEYFPRIKKKIMEVGPENLKYNNAGRSVEQALGYRKLPKEISFFADNMRTDDLLRFEALTSLTDVVNTYARQGFNKIHSNAPYQKMERFFRKVEKSGAQPKVTAKIRSYLEQIKGMDSSGDKRMLEEGTKDITSQVFKRMEKMGLVKNAEKHVTDDFVTLANKFTIASTMSMRAWLPIRNTFQPMLTLAPRVGNDVVFEAMKRAAANGDEIVNRLRRQGRIPNKTPIMDLVGGSDTLWIDRFNNKGMAAYQSSDALNRAVVDQTADILMNDAAMRYAKGQINEKQFINLSQVDTLDNLKQKEVIGHLRDGNYEMAKDTFADHLTWETQFPYKSGTNPAMFNGTYGRIFGGFGHYPVYYTANVLRGMKNAPGLKKAAWAARTVGNSLALYNIFNETLGVDPKAFLFYTPMNFSGGPYHQLLNTALDVTNATYYTGDIARKKLPGELAQLFIPGSAMMRSAGKAFEELEKGNTHGFVVNAFSAPLSENF